MRTHAPARSMMTCLSMPLTWRIVVGLVAACLLVPSAHPIFAQFASPTIDATIAADEYGDHTDLRNRKAANTGQYYMTWDATYLYFSRAGIPTTSPTVIYVDHNPIAVPNGGSNANGTLTGQAYDNVNFTTLPFRADFVAYFKEGSREYRTADGAGGWTAPTAGFGNYGFFPAGQVQELAIPWTAITGGGRPASFAFFAFMPVTDGTVVGEIPDQNPGAGGAVGLTGTATHYYEVVATATGTSAARPTRR